MTQNENKPAAAPIDVGVDCLEKLRALMVRLGLATNESLEGFGAALEDNLYRTIRAVGALVDAAAMPAPSPADERVAELAHEVWSAAQRAPGEGIEDGVQRIAVILSRSPAAEAVVDTHVCGCEPGECRDPFRDDCHYADPANCPSPVTAPQPAQADARVGLTDALRRAREELSIVEWENDPPSRVVKLFDEIDALLQGTDQ